MGLSSAESPKLSHDPCNENQTCLLWPEGNPAHFWVSRWMMWGQGLVVTTRQREEREGR